LVQHCSPGFRLRFHYGSSLHVQARHLAISANGLWLTNIRSPRSARVLAWNAALFRPTGPGQRDGRNGVIASVSLGEGVPAVRTVVDIPDVFSFQIRNRACQQAGRGECRDLNLQFSCCVHVSQLGSRTQIHRAWLPRLRRGSVRIHLAFDSAPRSAVALQSCLPVIAPPQPRHAIQVHVASPQK
jgi:hypothetical protein